MGTVLANKQHILAKVMHKVPHAMSSLTATHTQLSTIRVSLNIQKITH